MSGTRQSQRFNVRVPLTIRLIDSPSLPEREAESANISSRGVYFSTSFPFRIGERVEILLTMPEEVIGKPVREWRCHGRIVRTQKEAQSTALIGVGAEFLYYEILSKPSAPVSTHSVYGREA